MFINRRSNEINKDNISNVTHLIIVLVNADGLPLTLPVQDDAKNLDKLKVGDQIVTQITQDISVSIED